MHGNTNTLNLSANTSSTVVLASSQTRAYLFVQNKSATNQLYVSFGTVAGVSNGLMLGPGGAVEYFARNFMPLGDVAVSGTAGQPYVIIYC